MEKEKCDECGWEGNLEDCKVGEDTNNGEWVTFYFCPECNNII